VTDNVTSRVRVVREEHGWRAELVEPRVVRRSRTLHALDRQVRKVLGPGWVDYRFRTGDAELDRLVAGVRAARRTTQVAEELARELTEQVLERAGGLSRRELGILLDLSHQRVHQLVRRTDQDG
jgi:hypothetical protein